MRPTLLALVRRMMHSPVRVSLDGSTRAPCAASIRTGGVTSFIPDFLSNFIQFSVQTVAKCGIDPAAIPVSPNG